MEGLLNLPTSAWAFAFSQSGPTSRVRGLECQQSPSTELTPGVDAVPTDENSRSVRVRFHTLVNRNVKSLLSAANTSPHLGHGIPQILLVRRILNNRNDELIEIAHRVSDSTPPYAFDHLKPRYPPFLPWPKERGHDRVLGVRMDARACIAQIKRCPE